MPSKTSVPRSLPQTQAQLLASTTGINPNAISGPSSSSYQPHSSASLSPSPELKDVPPSMRVRVAPQPLPLPTTLDENGEVMRVPAFLQKLYT